jgi:LysM repeat protein
VLLLTGASLGLGYLYRNAVGDIRSLEEKIDKLNQTANSLRDEKDILMAKLVMAESRVGGTFSRNEKDTTKLSDDALSKNQVTPKEPELSLPSDPLEEEAVTTVSGNDQAVYHKVESGDSLYLISMSYDVPLNRLLEYNGLKKGHMIHPGQMLVIKPGSGTESKPERKAKKVALAKPTPSQKPEAPKSPPKTKPKPKSAATLAVQPNIKSETKPPIKKPETIPTNQEAQPKISVAAEKLTTSYDASANLLRVEYVLRNTGAKTKPINGHTLIVLKKAGQNPDTWLVLPSVPLEAGKPKGSEGYFFSIYNYRTIRFKIPNQSDKNQFTEAVVYVFSKEGDLVLEKQFTVSVKS